MILLESNMSIYEMIKQYPEIKNIMIELGFESITKPGMLLSAGKIMTIEKGSRMQNIDWDVIEKAFSAKGFEIRRTKA